MDQNERNGLSPIAHDAAAITPLRKRRLPATTPPARHTDPPPRSDPAPRVPLLLCDLTDRSVCSRREALTLLTGLLLLSTSPVAAAVDSLEEDPRRLAARLAEDPRLDQKISVTAWSEPLEDLLARLSRETGVDFTFEGRDVGDQRVNVVLNDQPLRCVPMLLAETLDLSWMRDRKAPGYRYTLFQDTRSRKEEQDLLARAREAFEEGIERLVDSLKLTPPQIEELRERDPFWARRLTDPPRCLAVRILGRLAPAHWEQWMQTGRVEIPYTGLSAADQALVRQYADEKNRDQARIQRDLELGQPGKHHIGDLTQPGGKVVLEIADGVPPGLDSEFGIDVASADQHRNGNALGLGYTPEEQRLLREALTPPGFEKETRNPPPSGGPRISPMWKEKLFLPWEEVLGAVVKVADLQIVSDSYLYYWREHNTLLPDPAALRDRPLAEVLDHVSEPYFYAWRRDGDVYLFRQRNWFLEKQHNVPERDLRRWRGHLNGGGRLTLEDLAELALLTDRQLGMVAHTIIPLGAVFSHRAALRLYAALNPFQRARLETAGLRLGELNAIQVERLRAWKPGVPPGVDARLALRRETEAVVFTLASGAPAPQEEHVPLERAKSLTSN